MEHKNFGLSKVSFEKLVADLKKNDTIFFEQVFLKQFDETIKYLRREYTADYEDAYDATMDTLLEFRARFVDGKLSYGNLRFLFTKMASQMFMRSKNKHSTDLDDVIYMIVEEEEDDLEDGLGLFNKAWETLGESCKKLLTFHFYGKMKLTEIAIEFQKTPETIRKQKERCVKGLKEQLGLKR
ncbi:RNA polymerase sigma factor [Aquimarina celericrescens]|uniref:RNA polymerase sigma factor n=1 Tax=Aquimarina celericrescens TaxID=1964542 RepID=A0ABW5AWI1_9FLAO|nr:sigma-70 family RNA polymerase sigma factor [Aquimarina celericrescens]